MITFGRYPTTLGDAGYTALWRPAEVGCRSARSPGDDLSHLQGGEQASTISGHTRGLSRVCLGIVCSLMQDAFGTAEVSNEISSN